jgi:hypothetical protein
MEQLQPSGSRGEHVGERAASWSYGLLVALATFVLSLSQVADYDLWWHLSYGDWLLAHRSFPVGDLFSHTAAGSHDVLYAWLFELVTAGAAHEIGVERLPLLQALLGASTFVVLYGACRALRLPAPSCAAGVLAAAPILRFHLVLRPHLASYVCLAVLVLLLVSSDRGRRPLVLGAAVPLLWVWRQIHASYPLGMAVLAVGLAWPHWSRVSKEAGEEAAHDSMRGAHRALIFCAAALCFVLPPLGWEGTAWIADTMRLVMPGGGLVTEWAPPTAFPGQFGPFWLYTVLGLLGLLASRRARTPLTVALFAAGSLMALSGIRHVCSFVILTLAPVTLAWTELCTRLAGRLALSLEIRRTVAVAGVLGASAWCVASSFGDAYPPFGLGVVQNAFPSGAAAFIEQTDLRGRMYNTHRLGGYLIWRLGELGHAEGRKVFWDGRLLLFRGLFEQIGNALAASDQEAAVDTLIQRLGVDYAVLDYPDENPIALRLREDPGWALVYWDDSAMVLVKRDGPGRRLLPLEWRLVRPWDRSLRFLDRTGADLPLLRAELGRKLDEDPRCARAAALYGTLLLKLGQARPAAIFVQRFLKSQKESEWVRVVLAQALLTDGRAREALDALEPLHGSGRSRAAVAEIERASRAALDAAAEARRP